MQHQHQRKSRVIAQAFVGLFALAQMIFSLAIIGLEAASVYYDAGRGTIYAGFWCSIFFFITWIATFCYLCCLRSVGYAVFLIIQNIISAIFAIILIIFTSLFVSDHCKCYGVLCKIPPWDCLNFDTTGFDYDDLYREYDCFGRSFKKPPVLKALLAFAIIMLVTNLIAIVIYLICCVRGRSQKSMSRKNQPSLKIVSHSPAPSHTNRNPYEPVVLAPTISEPAYYTVDTQIPSNSYQPSPALQVRSIKF